jgi:AcrR family transcriptional regulator
MTTTADQSARVDPGEPTNETPRSRLPRTERRAQLLTAAREVFVSKGYYAAAVEDIAERAGVTKPVVYQHFPGKLELYVALLEASAQALQEAVRAALGSTPENRSRVEATMTAYFAFVEDDGGAFRLVFESDLVHEPAVRERVEAAQHECAVLISDVIAEDAGLSVEQSMLLAVALTGMAQVSARWWLQTRAEIPRDEAARLIAQLAWRGISGFPRTGAVAPAVRVG